MKRTSNLNTLNILIATFALIILAGFALAQPQVKLPEGTEVRLKLMQALSSDTAKQGETISLQVLDEIKIDGVVVIPEGAPAWGTITEAEGKKSMGRGGKLAMQVDYVKAIDGSKIPLRANSVAQGKGRGTAVGVATAATAIAFWPAAPFMLMMKGKNVEIPRGHHIPAFVDGDRMIAIAPAVAAPAAPTTIQRVDNHPAPNVVQASLPLQSSLTARNVPPPPAELGVLNVISDPGGAEIEIDGAYYGNTPGLIKLPAGMHTITVRQAGLEAWKRTLNIGAGSNLTVKAELVKPVRRTAKR